MALFPALMLAGYWLGGEIALLYLAFVVPAMLALAGFLSGAGPIWRAEQHAVIGLGLRKAAIRRLDTSLQGAADTGKSCAAIVLQIDQFPSLQEQFGESAINAILKRIGERLQATVREDDLVTWLGDARYGVSTTPVGQLDLETLIQLCARLQAAVAEPLSIDATKVHLSASAGFCTAARAMPATGQGILDCANSALNEAVSNGAGSIRGFSPDLMRRKAVRSALSRQARSALDNGQVAAWFQPQVSAKTGEICGFEAVPHWEHPNHGPLSAADLLPMLREAGQAERLGEVMLYQALSALRDWDRDGLAIPLVSVNLSSGELRNPKLAEKIRWELDRFDVESCRLVIEIAEQAIADRKDDMIAQNMLALSKLGCRIDLDDFGTGHAGIASIRRFAVNRIKLHGSLVVRLDHDPDQRTMVEAVLSMAAKLGLETIANGVETVAEQAKLAELGCDQVQGSSIARPMPQAQAADWVAAYRGKLRDASRAIRRSS